MNTSIGCIPIISIDYQHTISVGEHNTQTPCNQICLMQLWIESNQPKIDRMLKNQIKLKLQRKYTQSLNGIKWIYDRKCVIYSVAPVWPGNIHRQYSIIFESLPIWDYKEFLGIESSMQFECNAQWEINFWISSQTQTKCFGWMSSVFASDERLKMHFEIPNSNSILVAAFHLAPIYLRSSVSLSVQICYFFSHFLSAK